VIFTKKEETCSLQWYRGVDGFFSCASANLFLYQLLDDEKRLTSGISEIGTLPACDKET